jgi:influenza virus NS1A-binding protein
MQENARIMIRALNNELPKEKRNPNLGGPFCVSKTLKELLVHEGQHLADIIATGGYVDGKTVNTVTSLDLVTKRRRHLPPMINARQDHANAILDGKLFVIAGCQDQILSNVEYLDYKKLQWYEVTPLTIPRYDHCAAVFRGKIFVAGGSSHINTMEASVECFNPAKNRWKTVAPMNTPRKAFMFMSTYDKLFAVGGHNILDGILSSVECFNPSKNRWETVAHMNTPRADMAVAVVGDKMFVIGGWNLDGALRSVESLDLSNPDSKWTIEASMTSHRHSIVAVVESGKIYIAGSNKIECFNHFTPSVKSK